MKVSRNAGISVISFLLALALYFPYMAIYISIFPPDDHGITAFIYIALYVCFVLLILYLTGLLFMKPTGKRKNDILSVGILGIALFVLYTAITFFAMFIDRETYFQLFLSTKEIKYLGMLTAQIAVTFVACFIPSLCLWLGMFSKKVNRIKIKETLTQAKLKREQLPEETENTG